VPHRTPTLRLLLLASVAATCACSGDPAPDADPTLIHVRFEPDGEGFYRLPWPSDARLTERGTPDLTDFPRRRGLLATTLQEIERDVEGFATMPVVYLALSGPVSEAALPQGLDALSPTSPIQMIDVSEAGCGARLPLEVAVSTATDGLRVENTLQVANAIGTVLTPRRPYAVIVLRTFGAEEARSTARPQAFDRALADTEGADALSRSLSPLRRCLPDAGVDLDDVAVATVFTPQDPVADMHALRDFVADPARIDTRPVRDWQPSEAWSRHRLHLSTFTGVLEMPVFQEGVSPYESAGGALVFDAAGQPVVQRWEDVDFAVAVGTPETPPTGPRPVLVFMDGTGWEPWQHLGSNWILEALAEGYVVMSFMPQFHGGRAGFAANTEIASFNIPNPPAGRTNFQQEAAEISYFLRVARERIVGLPGLPDLDTDNPVYGGHSQGAVCGSMVAAVESDFRGYVFNGLSSYLTLTILHREDIFDFDAIIKTLYAFTGTLDRFHPLLQIIQLGAEVVDPHNYVPRWHGWDGNPRGSHVFVSNGYEDVTTTPRGIEHMTMAANMPPIETPGWEVDPVGVWDGMPVTLPVQGNESSADGEPLTMATFLDVDQGHGTIYARPFARQLALSFWRTARVGTPRLSSTNEYECGDGADEDEDGTVDCADPDCAMRPPCVEGSCRNGVDEDGNGLIDCADPVCEGQPACREASCTNGTDDDGDGAADCADSDCAGLAPCPEGDCADRVDGDGDGDTDCADSDCADSNACHERRCADRVDDDGDGRTDCADDECVTSVACPEASCDDGSDEDANGLTDCADPGCAGSPMCVQTREMDCSNGTDDDGDMVADCGDADCAREPTCAMVTCADGDLGRQLGVALFVGDLAGETNDYPPADCLPLGTGADTPDLALLWTAPSAGDYVISTRGSGLDTVLNVLGPDCDPAHELACNDDESPVATSTVTVTLTEGESIVIVIAAYDPEEARGSVRLHIYPRP